MAKHTLQKYVEIAKELIDDYSALRVMQRAMDDMSNLEWELPSGLSLEWIRKVKTTAPHDTIKAGVRVLSGLDERIRLDPYSFPQGGEAAKKSANEWETALKWQMDRAARRRAILRQDVVRSALMYDEIVGQVVHLPTQIKTIKKLGGKTNRQEAALRYGDFVINLRNPKNVYTRYSDYMLEAVLYVSVRSPQSIVDFWNSKELGRLIEDEEAADDWVLFDYVDYDRRVVFCYPGTSVETINADENDEAIELLNEKWDLDFLPWSCVIGGTQIGSSPENSRFPVLYGIYKTDHWINTNIIGTLQISEAIAEAARPDVKIVGIKPESVQAQYGQPGGAWNVPTGHDVIGMPERGLDPALREAYDRYISEMNRSTIPTVLVTAEAAPNEPGFGFNLRITQAMASLMPFKFLAERWFEETYRTMLYWAKESGRGIKGYGLDGASYEIKPEDIDKNSIYMKVELQADVPIDRQQRLLSAIQASRELKLPTRDVLEMLGETNPEKKIEEWMMEQLTMAYLQGTVQQIQTEASGAIQQAIQQGAQQLAQQQMQTMMQQQATANAQAPAPGAASGVPGAEGQIFNPAEGGFPAQMAFPGATFEGQTGTVRTGEPMIA